MIKFFAVGGAVQLRLFTTPNIGFYEARNVPRTRSAILLIIQAPMEDNTTTTAIYGIGKREVKNLDEQGIPHIPAVELSEQDRDLINGYFSHQAGMVVDAWYNEICGGLRDDTDKVQ